MISKRTVLLFCENYKSIENYDKAIADDSQTWICHHRLETHNSDGKPRMAALSSAELKALDMYFNRPPEELIFVTKSEHAKIHGKYATWFIKKGADNYFAQHRFVGSSNHMYGKHHTDETRKNISESLKQNKTITEGTFTGKHHTEEARRKMRDARKARGTGYKQLNRAKRHWRKREDGSREWF